MRVSVLAAMGVLLLGAGVALGVSTYRQSTVTASIADPAAASANPLQTPGPTASAAPTAADPLAPAKGSAAPSFDIVRVAPDGGTIIAGRAEPGTTVTVRENGQAVGQARADGHGSWVMTPGTKLAPGAGELTVTAQGPAGGVQAAESSVLVVVPTPAAPSTPALALLSSPTAPSRILQAPAAPASQGPASQSPGSQSQASAAPGRKLGLDTVDYDEHGAIRFSGSAPPEAPVRVYVDNTPVGDAKAGVDGHWAISPPVEMPAGVHNLRLDQLSAEGHVSSRVELPFQRETLALAQVANGQVVVQPGQNLWRLARRAYGAGIRYTVIFMANREQIRDARLIYPGQVFAVPDSNGPVVATPAVAH